MKGIEVIPGWELKHWMQEEDKWLPLELKCQICKVAYNEPIHQHFREETDITFCFTTWDKETGNKPKKFYGRIKCEVKELK